MILGLGCIILTKVSKSPCFREVVLIHLCTGENFIPPGLANTQNSGSPLFNSSIASFNTWLQGFLPDFSDRNIQHVTSMYPDSGSSEGISAYNTTYTRAGFIYRDLVLACPAYWMARASRKQSYVGEYMISPAKHASDTEWVCLSLPVPSLAVPK